MSTSELSRTNVSARSIGNLPFFLTDEHGANGAPVWTGAAPEKLVKHFLSGNQQQAWRAWKRHLARRRSPWTNTALEAFEPAQLLCWGCSSEQTGGETRAAISALYEDSGLQGDAQQRALAALLPDGNNELDLPAAQLHLACAYALPALAAVVPERLWWQALGRLYQTARDAAALELATEPLLHQWLAGELPLALATLFPELTCCAELHSGGRRALSIGLDELLDGEGMPHCRYLDIQWPLVACWTRVRSLSASQECWDDAAEAQYPYAVREMLRLADHRGGSLFVHSPSEDRGERKARFFAAAVSLSGDKGNRAALQSTRWKGLPQARSDKKRQPPSAANHSEWAHVGVLRSAWKRSSPHLAIAYGERIMRGELTIGRDHVFTGNWPFTVSVDGRDAAPAGDWESNCWVSDEDMDYLELEIALGGGLKLQRQLCLARKDRFLFVADAVLGAQARPLRHQFQLPLGPEVTAFSVDETREVRICAPGTKAMVFPLSLPEWRVEGRSGELSTDRCQLELQQSITGANLYAPLWIDLDADRQRKPFTWRQLTVAEERQIVSRDVAVGYRVQFGKQQWLIYRSLTPPRNRTVLGHNLATDFLIARFDRNGSVRALIEVE